MELPRSREDLYEKDYFLSLKPYQSVVEAAWKLYESGEAEVFIRLRFSDDSRYAISEKDAWLNEDRVLWMWTTGYMSKAPFPSICVFRAVLE